MTSRLVLLDPTERPPSPRRTPLAVAPLVYILELLQMKEEPPPPSSWFRHVGKLAVLAAAPKQCLGLCNACRHRAGLRSVSTTQLTLSGAA